MVRLIVAAVFALLSTILIRGFLIETYVIPGISMEPSLLPGDQIIVNKRAYNSSHLPELRDVVVFEQFSEFNASKIPYIKRIIAVSGDVVEIVDGYTIVNSSKTFIGRNASLPDFGPLKLGTGEYFLIGDNTTNSQDSRMFGPVKIDSFIGKAICIFWSRERTKTFPFGIRWNRFGLLIK